MEEKDKRNNHYVPKVYAKQWCYSKKRVWCYDLLLLDNRQPCWNSRNIKDFMKLRDFYSLGQTDDIDDSIERYFEIEYENRINSVLAKIRNGTALENSEMKDLIEFAILQMVRTPKWFERHTRQSNDVLSAALESFLTPYYRVIPISEMEVASSEAFKMTIPAKSSPFPSLKVHGLIDATRGLAAIEHDSTRESYLHGIDQVINGKVGEHLRNCHWHIYRTSSKCLLPTSDNPFVSLGRIGDQYTVHGSLDEAGTLLFMPVSPYHILYTIVGSQNEINGYVSDADLFEDVLTQAIVCNAWRQVISIERNSTFESIRRPYVDAKLYKALDEAGFHWMEMVD